jgi:histidyl-tRNA synthetase
VEEIMKINNVKGFRDLLGDEAVKRAGVRKIVQEQFELYGLEPAETPTIEFEEFVKGGEERNDVVSEIFKLEDRGKRKLSLKYESTFQLKRIAKNQKLPYKVYQISRVFRDEPTSSNRLREFTQCDADIVGSSLNDEAEFFSLVKSILDRLGIKSTIYINNMKLLNEIMVCENIEEKYRGDVIHELDKLDKLSKKEVADNLKKFNAEKILKIFEGGDKDFEKYNYYGEIKELKKMCKFYGVNVVFQANLSRGLSYYNGTIFEIKTKKMKETICGGGAYPIVGIQSFGFSLGLDRLSTLSSIKGEKTKVQIISIGNDKPSIILANTLRENGISVNLLLNKSLGKAMDYANSRGIGKVIFVGEEEIKKNKFKIKDMSSGEEEFLSEPNLLKSLL